MRTGESHSQGVLLTSALFQRFFMKYRKITSRDVIMSDIYQKFISKTKFCSAKNKYFFTFFSREVVFTTTM